MKFTSKPTFRVLRRTALAGGGFGATEVSGWLSEAEANALADKLQAEFPEEQYAVCELVFHRHTKPRTEE